MTLPLSRAAAIEALAGRTFDLAIIGGGATGLAIALEATRSGYSVALIDRGDFANGTSSRSTKLLHGGVRYLAQGNLRLVREALRERRYLIDSAPELAQPLRFVMPAYRWFDQPLYGIGLKLYARLAGAASLGPTRVIDPRKTLESSPALRVEGLRGSVSYWDAQFDDAGMAIAMARTAAQSGAVLVNYVNVDATHEEAGRVCGLRCRDVESECPFIIRANAVINACGVWVDTFRQSSPLVRPSQGTHVVVDAEFFPGDDALLIPHTRDGRVLFVVPWLGKRILGTTDIATSITEDEPRPQPWEVAQILEEIAPYVARAPTHADVKSVWSGLRPLVQTAQTSNAALTGSISREHYIDTDPRGLLTITGGKWTTCFEMARDALDHARKAGLIDTRHPSESTTTKLMSPVAVPHDKAPDAQTIAALAHHTFARQVGDILARRSRLLFLDARAAIAAAPSVARTLSEVTGQDAGLDSFLTCARHYLPD